MIAESRAAYERGEWITSEELRAQLGLPAEDCSPVSIRAELHDLIDALPEATLPVVTRYLEAVYAGCPPDDPYDDEPLSPEEEAMLAESRAAIARGEFLTHEQVLARRVARRSTP
jgi:hypothetical protein